MASSGAGSTVPTVAQRALRLLLATATFVAAGYLGRLTVLDENALSLVWPAAGVAALWLSSGSRHTWAVDVAALAAATFTVNVTTGASVPVAGASVVSNVLQVGVFVVLARRWADDVWGLGGRTPLHRLVDLGRLVVASMTAALVGAGTGALGLWLTAGGTDFSSFLVWWGRNTVGMVVIIAFGLLAGPPLTAARSVRDLGRILYESVHARTLGRLVEAEVLIAASIGLYVLLFAQRGGAPLSFLVLVVSIWAGLRFTPLAVMAHGLAMGVAGIVFTLNDYGPFAAIESPRVQALVAQVFVATTVLTGLSLAFSRGERDRANRRLAEARRQSDERARLLSAVLESMNEGLVVVEDGGRVLVINSASKRLLGLTELQGQVRPAADYQLFHADGTPLADDEMPGTRALDGQEVVATDFHLRADSVPGGRVLEIGARPLASQDAEDRRLAVVNIRDVTVDRQHRDALASFAGVVAHDLFSPLTIASGWTEALQEEFADGPVSAQVGLPMLDRVDEANRHMRHVIGDLLAYTVARDQSLRPGAVDLSAEIEALASLRAHGPGSPLFTIAPDLRVWADAGLVRQLFDNLLGNAVKYVAAGARPHVRVTGVVDGDWLVVEVQDNGIGIPEDQRELVFESFHRVHRDGYQGTGLGLAICRRIVDRHGGTIRAEAGPDGTGTTIVLCLPSTAAAYSSMPDRARHVRAVPPPQQAVQA